MKKDDSHGAGGAGGASAVQSAPPRPPPRTGNATAMLLLLYPSNRPPMPAARTSVYTCTGGVCQPEPKLRQERIQRTPRGVGLQSLGAGQVTAAVSTTWRVWSCVQLAGGSGRGGPADRAVQREPFPPVCRLTPPLLRVTHPSPRERVGERVRNGGGAASEGRHAAIPPAMCSSHTRVDRRSGHASVRKARAVEQRSTLVPSGTAIVPHSQCPSGGKTFSLLATSALD